MPVLAIFGENLRRLCAARDLSLAQAARDLGLGKVQFQRMLKAESFPKPNLLQRICLYFGTDARILTETWPFPPPELPPLPKVMAGLMQVAQYTALPESHFAPDPGLPDGHYTFFRRSMSRYGYVARTVVQIKSLSQSRILRAFDFPQPKQSGWSRKTPKQREFRGMVFKQGVGTTIILVHPESHALSSIYLQPQTTHYADTRYYGVTNYGRIEQADIVNTTRLVWIAVEPRFSDILQAHRARGLYRPEEVPQDIADFLFRPL